MVSKENQFACAFTIDQVRQPRNLIVRQARLVVLPIGIVVCAVESDQQPMIVLKGKVTSLLTELRERLLEVGLPASVHFVV